MIIVLSPAKTLDYTTQRNIDDFSSPVFLNKSKNLIGELKKKKSKEISSLMKLSDKLTSLNVERYQNWKGQIKPSDNAQQSIYVFKGDVYQGLDIDSFTKKDINFAQKHLRILSGLYGILKPLDIIEPYRLEMGSKLKTEQGNNLYEYWNKKIALAINELSDETNSKILVNCASQEYFHAVDISYLRPKVITPVFMENKNGKNKIISFFAKKARGLMARYIIENRVRKIDDLKKFNFENYKYRRELSTEKHLIFLR